MPARHDHCGPGSLVFKVQRRKSPAVQGEQGLNAVPGEKRVPGIPRGKVDNYVRRAEMNDFPKTEGQRRYQQLTAGKKKSKLEQKDSYWLGKFGPASKVRMIDPKSIKLSDKSDT